MLFRSYFPKNGTVPNLDVDYEIIGTVSYNPHTGINVLRPFNPLTDVTTELTSGNLIMDNNYLYRLKKNKKVHNEIPRSIQPQFYHENPHFKKPESNPETLKVIEESKASYMNDLATKIVPEPIPGEPNTTELALIFKNENIINRRFFKHQLIWDIILFCQFELKTVEKIKLTLFDTKVVLNKDDLILSFCERENTICVEAITGKSK